MGFIKFDTNEFCRNLQSGVGEVIFQKLDGEIRKMKCTLAQDRLPANRDVKKIDEMHRQNHEYLNIGVNPPIDTITVWDLDANGWRSFRADRVISAQYLNVG